MKSFQYEITDDTCMKEGTAGLLVKEAVKADSTVILECNGKTGDAKRLFNIMGMDIKKGDKIAVLIEGEDETETAESIERIFNKYF